MDVNAYLPMAVEALAGALFSGLIASALRARGGIAALLGLLAGIGLGFWLEYAGYLSAVSSALGDGWAGLLGSAAIAGGAGGAAAGLVSALILRRR